MELLAFILAFGLLVIIPLAVVIARRGGSMEGFDRREYEDKFMWHAYANSGPNAWVADVKAHRQRKRARRNHGRGA